MKNKPSDKRNGNFLDSNWCCKVCDGEIPYGHTHDCDIWKLEKELNELRKCLAEYVEACPAWRHSETEREDRAKALLKKTI
jgi:hypothetical protein